MNKIWIAWESHRRTKELASALGLQLFILESSLPRIFKYPVLLYKTVVIYLVHKPDVVFVQNPSIVLAVCSCFIKNIFNFRLVADLHNAAIIPESNIQKKIYFLYKYVHKKADINIVTNSGLKEKIICNVPNANVVILPDKLPAINQVFNKSDLITNAYFVLICTFGIDEPFIEVIEAARLLDKSIFVYITGNSKRCSVEVKDNLPENVVLTGFLSDADYLNILKFSEGIIDLTNREDCLLCGAYEATALERPLILTNKKALRAYFYKGTVFCENDKQSIKDAILDVLQNKLLYEQQMIDLKKEIVVEWPIYLNCLNKKQEAFVT